MFYRIVSFDLKKGGREMWNWDDSVDDFYGEAFILKKSCTIKLFYTNKSSK